MGNIAGRFVKGTFINQMALKYDFSKHEKLHYKGTEESFGAIVVDKAYTSVLLIQDHGGIWSFPKGHRDDKESNIEAAIREIREETGVKISQDEFILDEKNQNPITFHLRYPWGYSKQSFEKHIEKVIKKQEEHPSERPYVNKPGKVKRHIQLYLVPVEMDRLRPQLEEVQTAQWVKWEDAFEKLSSSNSAHLEPLCEAFAYLKKINRIPQTITLPPITNQMKQSIKKQLAAALKEKMSIKGGDYSLMANASYNQYIDGVFAKKLIIVCFTLVSLLIILIILNRAPPRRHRLDSSEPHPPAP